MVRVNTNDAEWGHFMDKKMAKGDRLYLPALGEIYDDALRVEAYLKNRTMATEGNSLLCSILMKHAQYREEAVRYLARKRRITYEEMIEQILSEEAEELSTEDFQAIRKAEKENP